MPNLADLLLSFSVITKKVFLATAVLHLIESVSFTGFNECVQIRKIVKTYKQNENKQKTTTTNKRKYTTLKST